MSLNSTPSANRVHISIFGNRNAGKSSLINALTSQNLAIVSDVLGTTTDPVSKAMELLPLGPVVITDTPGLDDVGELGLARVSKSYDVLRKTDIAVLVVDISIGMTENDVKILNLIKEKKIPYIVVFNKAEMFDSYEAAFLMTNAITTHQIENAMYVSALTGLNINNLKEKIATLKPNKDNDTPLIKDKLQKGDVVILVTPIDSSAPKGRIILPQQQVLREVLDAHAVALVTQVEELSNTLSMLSSPPKVVITDSQAFKDVAKNVPSDILLTSFSILFARHKGNFAQILAGARTLDSLPENANVLISEGCTHHRQCEDIGTVKLPNLILKHTGKNINFEFTSGGEFPSDLSKYNLVIHCGGCTLNQKEIQHRLSSAANQGVPITNYGIALSHMNGILERTIAIFE